MNTNFKLLSIVYLLLLLTVTNCNTSRKTSVTTPKTNVKPTVKKVSVEDFTKFYNKFHVDSAFQISRIKFPLEGLRMDGTAKVKLTQKNWRMMRVRIYDVDATQFKVQYKKTDSSFTQKVWLDNSDFKSEQRFEVINGKWFLVYVLDQSL